LRNIFKTEHIERLSSMRKLILCIQPIRARSSGLPYGDAPRTNPIALLKGRAIVSTWVFLWCGSKKKKESEVEVSPDHDMCHRNITSVPCPSPGVDLSPCVEEDLDDVDVAPGRRQAEGRVVRDVAVLLVGCPQQQQLHHLAGARHSVGQQCTPNKGGEGGSDGC